MVKVRILTNDLPTLLDLARTTQGYIFVEDEDDYSLCYTDDLTAQSVYEFLHTQGGAVCD